MFSKLSLLAISACAVSLASALTLNVPENPTSQGEITVTWTTASGDPDLFSIYLVHPDFNDAFGVANNIDPASGSVTLTLPVVPAQGGYTLEAVNVGNINDVYSSTAPFTIGAVTASSAPSSTPSSTRTSASASGSSAVSGSVTRSSSAGSQSASSPTGSGSPSGTSSGSSPDVTNLNEDGAAASTVASRLGLLGAAVAGAVLAL